MNKTILKNMLRSEDEESSLVTSDDFSTTELQITQSQRYWPSIRFICDTCPEYFYDQHSRKRTA